MSKKNTIRYAPYILEAEAKTYAWCSCGQSQKQPFCDGSHGSVGMSPKIVQIPEKKSVAWCGCKATATPPFCDGTHKKFKS
ncbi:MAG: cytochrome C551 [Omnitrophica WOR_2 bacterium RIFCSPHIGHO2_01_FULL_48_9]|nr:MAG: cytochrome C551 [Omnitrophica WOR_2 bacterium RIFCSPHIGHO2_01_FULL_48_9]